MFSTVNFWTPDHVEPPVFIQPKSGELDCIHRGEQLGLANCGCAGKPPVHWCKLLEGHCTVNSTGKPWLKFYDLLDTHERVGKVGPCLICPHINCSTLEIPESIQQPPIDSLTAVTALSIKNHSVERQTLCLDSWKRFGLEIVAKNTEAEIDELWGLYPQVDRWIVENELSTHYDFPTQLIRNLADTAMELDRTVMVINSDIELLGPQSALLDAISPEAMTIGIRWNHDDDKRLAKEFEWGLDAFTFTPEQAAMIPKDFPFAIGHAMWDYAVPALFQNKGVPLRFVHEPIMFHRNHKQNWSPEGWHFGAEWTKRELGIEIVYSSNEFRRGLDPGWAYDKDRWRKASDIQPSQGHPAKLAGQV